MSDSDGWLERYGASHEHLTWPVAHWLAVPIAALGFSGVLWSLPVPAQFYEISPLLNWGSAFLMATAVYYFIISLSIAIGMLPFLLGLAGIHVAMERAGLPQPHVAAALLAAGCVGLVLGHLRGASLRSLVEDLMLVMIGPAWMLSIVYRRLGIPY